MLDEVLSKEFLSQFKTEADVSKFLKQFMPKYWKKCLKVKWMPIWSMKRTLGLKQNGLKEVLGMWVGKSESSSFWMGVLTDLKARGVQDILIYLHRQSEWIYECYPQCIPSVIHSSLCGTLGYKPL